MTSREIKKTIIEDLEKMTLSEQKKLHMFAQALLISRPAGGKGKELIKYSGMLDKKTVKEMKKAIEKNCERIDLNEW